MTARKRLTHGQVELRKQRRKLSGTVMILPDVMKTSTMRAVEMYLGEPLEIYLMRRFNNGDLHKEVADDLHVCESCISRWVHRLLIPR